jgi:hypothetical protein
METHRHREIERGERGGEKERGGERGEREKVEGTERGLQQRGERERERQRETESLRERERL